MESTLQVLLNLPDVRVLSVSKTDQGEWIIRLESTLSSALCQALRTRDPGLARPSWRADPLASLARL